MEECTHVLHPRAECVFMSEKLAAAGVCALVCVWDEEVFSAITLEPLSLSGCPGFNLEETALKSPVSIAFPDRILKPSLNRQHHDDGDADQAS